VTVTSITTPRARIRRLGGVEFVVKVAITLGLIGFLLAKVGLKAIALQVISVGPGAFALSTTIILMLSLLGSIRWAIILNAMSNPLGRWQCWRLVMIGMFFNQTLPSSIGGDAVRIWLITRLGKPLRVGFVSVAVDRLFALVAVGVCVWVALPLLLTGPAADLAIFVSLMAVIGSIGLFGFDAAAGWLSPLASRLAGKGLAAVAVRPINILRDLSRVFGLILRRPTEGVAVLTVSVVNQLSLGLVVYVIARALGVNVSLNDALLIFPLAMLLSMVPISLGGWGVREASMVWLFGTIGISTQEALGISVLFGLATTAAGLPGGLLWLLDRRSHSASKQPSQRHQ
jgi:glycosyltransferase 2 family protein